MGRAGSRGSVAILREGERLGLNMTTPRTGVAQAVLSDQRGPPLSRQVVEGRPWRG
jgi:hypothetical protein